VLTGLGQAAPWIAAAVAVASMLSKESTPHVGGLAFGSPNGFASPDTAAAIRDYLYATPKWDGDRSWIERSQTNFLENDWTRRENQQVTDSLGKVAQSFAGTVNAIARQYGAGSGYQVGLAFSADGDDGSRGRFGIIKDGRILAGSRQRYSSDMEKGMAQFLADVPSELVAALREVDLDPFVDAFLDKSATATGDALEGLADASANAILSAMQSGWLDEFLAQMDTAGMSFEAITAEIIDFARVANLKPVFDALALDIYSLGTALTDALGGADAAGAALSAYYDAFYGEEEKLANVQKIVTAEFDKWGAAVPATMAEFRALGDALAAMGLEGTDAYAALIKIAPAFAQLHQDVDQATDDLSGFAKAAEERHRDALDTLADAQSDLLDAYQREADLKSGLAGQMRGYADSLRDFRQSLLIGDLSPLNPRAKYEEAQRQYQDLARRAQLGDTAAIDRLQGGVEGFLNNSKAYYGANSAAYSSDFFGALDVLQNTESLAERQARIAEEQLAELKRQVGELVDIDAGVKSLEDAIFAFKAAQAAVGTAGSSGLSIIAPPSTPAVATLNTVFQDNYLASMVNKVAKDPAQAEAQAALAISAGFSPDQIAAKWNEKTGSSLTGYELASWLNEKKLNGYAVGANYIPNDQIALLHRGEEVRPAPYVEKDRAERAETNALLRQLLAELQADKAQRGAIGTGTIERLEVVVESLEAQRRELRRAA
jgi:hypothetical protein